MSNMIWALAFLAAVFASEAPHGQFIVHEWGTYTSMQGSNGVGQAGLHHGEEAMPHFVHSRADGFVGDYSTLGRKLNGILPPTNTYAQTHPECAWCRSVDFDPVAGSPTEVTQKLETPVLYFYSPTPLDVQVDVSFPNGVVTEVYPNMASFTPAFQRLQAVANGTATWKVHVLAPHEDLPVPEVPADHIWAPSRRVSANQVSFRGEVENLIFYRGVGRFQAELQVTSTHNSVTIRNTHTEDVSAVFLLETTGSHGYIRSLGALKGNQATTSIIDGERLGDDLLPINLFTTRAVVLLEKALVEAGLYPLEARAMVDTWTRSYFQTPGVRVLYVSPQRWANRLLPTTVTPQPDDFIRVFVGRVEVMLATAEKRITTHLASIPADATYEQVKETLVNKVNVATLQRFGDAKLRRAAQIAQLPQPIQVHLERFILNELNE